jgi:hypothetical protein
MTARGLNRSTLPDPRHFGPKADFDLGEALENWFTDCVAGAFFGGKLLPNALFYLGRHAELAAEWEASDDHFIRMMGIIAGVFPASSVTQSRVAGRLYRNLVQSEKETTRLRRMIETKKKKQRSRLVEIAKVGLELREQEIAKGWWPADNQEIAQKIKTRVGGKAGTIRQDLPKLELDADLWREIRRTQNVPTKKRRVNTPRKK